MTPWLSNGHLDAWIVQLDELARKYGNYIILYPGHGDSGPPAQLLQEQRAYLVFFKDLVAKELAGETSLSDEAKRRVRLATEAKYPGYAGVAPSPTLIEMNATAELLTQTRRRIRDSMVTRQ